ncbi:hypothetical protein [Actinomadura sp. DC4]|uniref:hypothetical protein n=1 Tax=Actinomadura sp. DC4 TaxID=3055069 RepID=UPI0025AF5A1E|nr:hypothetical protein [Actinomadura sp. DC4]MDN3357619.1 hypothetical protein [Actinomadura sp. DC4]
MQLYADVIALSQGLVAAKFYQTVLARLTVRNIPGKLARFTEVLIRSMTVVAVPTTLLSTVSSSTYWMWPWTCAAGAVAVAACNCLTYFLADRILSAARDGLSTVPDADRKFARGYEQWWWTMLLYAFIIATIATGLQVGALKDRWAYVFVLVIITVGVHYAAKCAAAGPAVRGSIARAFSTGERIAVSSRHPSDPMTWPPRLFSPHDPPPAELRRGR